jgi:hypothetical protein
MIRDGGKKKLKDLLGCVNTASMVSKVETRHCSEYKRSQASIHVQQSPLFIEVGDYIIFNSFCFGWWLSIYLSTLVDSVFLSS